MAGFGEHQWPDRFMPDIAARIADNVSGMDRNLVFSSVYDDSVHLEWPPADRFVTLFTSSFPVDQPDVSGGGEYNTPFDCKLIVTAFCRLEADPEVRSTQELEDATFGVYRFLKDILTALQMYPGAILTGDTLYYLRRPLRISPGFEIRKKSGKASTRWAVAPMTFEMSFVADLGVDYP